MLHSYTITERDNCTLILGAIPIDVLQFFASRHENCVLDPDLARLAEVNNAIGSPEDTERLRTKLIDIQRPHYYRRYANQNLSNEAIEWLLAGDQGLSSCAIFLKTTGVMPDLFHRVTHQGAQVSHPRDGGDVYRCMRLLMAVPQCQDNFHLVAALSPEWAALYASWSQLQTAIQDDLRTQAKNPKSPSKTHRLMNRILESIIPTVLDHADL